MKKLFVLLIFAMTLARLLAQEKEEPENKNSIALNIYNLFNKDFFDNSIPTFIFIHKNSVNLNEIRISSIFSFDNTKINGVDTDIFDNEFTIGENTCWSNRYNIGLSIGSQRKKTIIENFCFFYGNDIGYRINQNKEVLKNYVFEQMITKTVTGHNLEIRPFIGISYSALKKISLSLESYYVAQIRIIKRSYSNRYYMQDSETSDIEILLPKRLGLALLITYHF